MEVIVRDYYTAEEKTVDIENLYYWIRFQHKGAVIVRPPELHPDGKWVILTSDNNRFTQR